MFGKEKKGTRKGTVNHSCGTEHDRDRAYGSISIRFGACDAMRVHDASTSRRQHHTFCLFHSQSTQLSEAGKKRKAAEGILSNHLAFARSYPGVIVIVSKQSVALSSNPSGVERVENSTGYLESR